MMFVSCERVYVISYYCLIETLVLSLTISEILRIYNSATIATIYPQQKNDNSALCHECRLSVCLLRLLLCYSAHCVYCTLRHPMTIRHASQVDIGILSKRLSLTSLDTLLYKLDK